MHLQQAFCDCPNCIICSKCIQTWTRFFFFLWIDGAVTLTKLKIECTKDLVGLIDISFKTNDSLHGVNSGLTEGVKEARNMIRDDPYISLFHHSNFICPPKQKSGKFEGRVQDNKDPAALVSALF